MPFATYKNLAGFSPEKIALLEKDFAGLNESRGDLAERAVRYVVDGDDANVLEALAKAHNPAQQLRLIRPLGTYHPNNHDDAARNDFFATVEPGASEPYLRLAKVYEAAAKGSSSVQLHFQIYYGGLPWLELFLQEVWIRGMRLQIRRHVQPYFPLSLIEDMLAAEGHDPALLIKNLFSTEPQDNLRFLWAMTFKALSGFNASITKHREVVANALLQADAARKVELLEMLDKHDVSPDSFLPELVSLATSGAKTVREATVPLLSHVREQARPFVEQVAMQGAATERAAAIRWLARFACDVAKEFLLARQQAENAPKVQEAIGEALSELTDSPAAVTCDTAPCLPPIGPVETVVPLTASAREAIAELIEAYNEAAIERNQALALHRQQHPGHGQPDSPIYDQTRIDETCRLLETLTDAAPLLNGEPPLPLLYGANTFDHFNRLAQHPDIRLIHLVRLMTLTGYITARHWANPTMFWGTDGSLRAYHEHHIPGVTLREFAAVLEGIGIDSRMIGYELLSGDQSRFQWLADGSVEYFSERLDILQKSLDARALAGTFHYEWLGARTNALKLLSHFPSVPPSLIGRIWQIAIGAGKTDRAAAQRIMERVPDFRQRVADALTSGDYQTRVVAAEWLGRSRDKQAAAVLHKALAKEKQDAAKDAMLTALERLGEAIDRYLDRDQLLAAAERGLKKGLHKDLAWFPCHSWPEVRWQNSNEPVPVEILNWFLANTHKLGSPEAGALLRRYCRQFAPDDRQTLGLFVLRSWIEHDIHRKHSDAQARQLAKQQAAQSHRMFPQVMTLQQWEDAAYRMLSLECLGSAVKQKGILALAAACCGDEAVKIVGDYLKQWYGHRAAQCKALVAMLASLDRPAAIQLLLSVANRFRTKGIREEAEKYVKIVAERKGWTIDELADRTVPTAGFDDSLSLELDYGSRQLTARLLPDFTIALADENGKPLKSLPEPRKDDDPDKAKAARKQLSTAKSELKKLVAQQKARLYEAMCTERTWSYADWNAYLHQHPIVGRLCQRLVWAVLDGERLSQTFRPLDDGTLTDENDEQVVVPAGAQLRLAHGSLVSPETSAAWTQHFADYEVELLFVQFGRPGYVLPDDKQDATELADFEGHLIEAFKLRGLATRLGYTRGPAQDGGWFYHYEKTLAGMGLKLELRFSGNGLPEENRTVALMSLHFLPTGGESAGMPFDQPGTPLRDVPGVLLSECYHDLATIAAAGTGYDADWQKKVGM
ncbi:MAG TPA: DUF4132 domain-containing protein [Pirellulales bacterium]|nr:DUF4132 domain-containing protein [Pirellulales bacterium]